MLIRKVSVFMNATFHTQVRCSPLKKTMQKLLIKLTGLITLSFPIFGLTQNSVIDFEKNINPYLQSDNWIYTTLEHDGREVINFEIDTFNICRIQKSKIKSVSIYYYESEKDSVFWMLREYNEFGISNDLNLIEDPYLKRDPQSIKIDCSEDILEYQFNMNGVYKRNYILSRMKIIQKYNKFGYLTEYTQITKGILNRWLQINAFGGTAKFHRLYEYSNNYQNVICTWCYKKKLRTEICKTKILWFLEFDENRNLISEMEYREQENGSLKFVSGFKYFYEFY